MKSSALSFQKPTPDFGRDLHYALPTFLSDLLTKTVRNDPLVEQFLQLVLSDKVLPSLSPILYHLDEGSTRSAFCHDKTA